MRRRALNGTGKARHTAAEGLMAGAVMAAEAAMDGMTRTARVEGERAVSYARNTVSAKPLTSVALAFGGGVLAAYLIGRCRR